MAGEGDDEEIGTGAEGQGAEGQDPAGGQPEGDLSPEQPEPETDDGEQEVAEPAGDGEKPSRGQNRFQTLANKNRELEEKLTRLEREREDERRAGWQRQTEQTEAQQREMLALMTPEERAEWRIQRMEQKQAQERQQDRMQIASMMDKTGYDAKATVNPVYAKYKDEVEARFAEQMRQGRPVDREILLKVILGERALQGAGNTKTRRAAQNRVEAQRVSPGGGKGDTPSDRGKAGDTAEKRLQGVII